MIEYADRVQKAMLVQKTVHGAWEERNDKIINEIEERVANAGNSPSE